MRINIIGDGSFGSFLKKELPNYGFEILPLSFPLPIESQAVILAVPFSAYESVVRTVLDNSFYNSKMHSKHPLIVNVCSVQRPSTEILLKYTDRVTSIHPLFGIRTPSDKRNSILTYTHVPSTCSAATDEQLFLHLFGKFSNVKNIVDWNDKLKGCEEHDRLMAKVHAPALLAAKQLEHYIKDAEDVPDELLPNSFRLMKNFVQTMLDMPSGTVESIMANPYI